MKSKNLTIPMGFAALVLAAGSPTLAQSVNSGDCNAARPPVASPDLDSGAAQPGDVQRDSLTEQLATCGSVLNPPAVGDPEVVQPAPVIDDPMAIHPRDPQLKKQ